MEKIRIVAEIAQAHDGSLGMAHSLIQSSADSGATDIKFQMHYAEHESTKNDEFRVDSFPQDKTRYDYWKRMEFSLDQWDELFKHCRNLDLNVIVSPFSHFAIERCKKLGIFSLKLGSGETNNHKLIKHAGEESNEIILSTGMSSWKEISDAIKNAKLFCPNIYTLQCTSKYPSPLEEVGLNCIKKIVNDFKVKSGLSDHSGKLSPSLAAVAQGYTSMIEIHVTHSKDSFGPDSSSSLDFNNLKLLSSLIREIELIKSHEIDKDLSSKDFKDMKVLFGRSLVARRDISLGEIISEDLISYKKPGGGIEYKNIDKILGKRTKFLIKKDEMISYENLL